MKPGVQGQTVHLVYPGGPGISSPQAIGRNLVLHLSRRYLVRRWEWDDVRVIRPRPGDVLIGHAHPAPWTVFRMSSRVPGWSRVIALQPFAHGLPEYIAFLDPVLRRCDQFLAITGPHWIRTLDRSPVAHWAPKLVPMDLAIDRSDYPRVKSRFNPPGSRRFLYIGNTRAPKNPGYLVRIARRLPGTEIAWMGSGRHAMAGIRRLGAQDFSSERARRLVAEYDFVLTVGSSDANPTTVLEAMAWGLIPVCTPQSGYEGEEGIVNVPLDDVDEAAAVLDGLQQAPEPYLLALRDANDMALDRRYTWDRFAGRVIDAIESSASPDLAAARPGARFELALQAFRSPDAAWRPSSLLRLGSANVGRAVRRLRRPPGARR